MKLIILQFLVIVSSLLEVVSVLAIGPFMSLIADPEIIEVNKNLNFLFELSDATDILNFLFFISIFIILLLLISSLLSMYTLWQLSLYSQAIGADLSNRLYNFYLDQPWLFHAAGNSSELINRISQECQRLTDQVIMPAIQTVSKCTLAVFMIVALLIYDPWVGMVGALVFTLFYYIIYVVMFDQFAKNGGDITTSQSSRLRLMGEGFGGMKDVLVLGRSRLFIDRFQLASNKLAIAKGLNAALSQIPRYAIEFMALGAVIGLIIFQIIYNSGSLATLIPVLSVYSLATFKLLPAFQQIYFNISSIRGNLAAFDSIHEDLRNSVNNSLSISDRSISSNSKKIDLCLENVSFSYPNATNMTLADISLKISTNEVLGFVGHSGSGKTTLIDIILGLISPTKGKILIDSKIITKENIRSWQDRIGFVSQTIFLSDASIEENIAFGLPKELINKEKINSAIKLSHLDELVNALENGVQTRVGERGIQLSGGQRQRIGIARALYHNPDILIFDEATSALDGITEKVIMDAIHDFSGKKTILIIAHRLATVKRCTRIFLLDKGKIIDSGTYDELNHRNKIFKNMAENA